MLASKTDRRSDARTLPSEVGGRSAFSSGLKRVMRRTEDATRRVIRAALLTDCLACGKCCGGKTFLSIYTDDSAKPFFLRIREQGRTSGVSMMEQGPELLVALEGDCPFLGPNTNTCAIYSSSSNACKEYPFVLQLAGVSGRLINYLLLSSKCPTLASLRDQGINMIFASDLIFPIDEALKDPSRYVHDHEIANFRLALYAALGRGETHYVVPFLGAALQAVFDNYKNKRMPYNKMPNSPILRVDNELVFPIGMLPESVFS